MPVVSTRMASLGSQAQGTLLLIADAARLLRMHSLLLIVGCKVVCYLLQGVQFCGGLRRHEGLVPLPGRLDGRRLQHTHAGGPPAAA